MLKHQRAWLGRGLKSQGRERAAAPVGVRACARAHLGERTAQYDQCQVIDHGSYLTFAPMASPPQEELLPTPMKSHYTFNLRDLSKVFQGMLMVTPSSCKDKETMERLWVHEACRVFHDRCAWAVCACACVCVSCVCVRV